MRYFRSSESCGLFLLQKWKKLGTQSVPSQPTQQKISHMLRMPTFCSFVFVIIITKVSRYFQKVPIYF